MKWKKWLRNGLEALLPPRTLIIVDEGDLPDRLPRRDLVLLRGLLNATALQDLREFHDNPKGLQTLLAHGLLQWD